MSETYAIDHSTLVKAHVGDALDAQPLCPACVNGRLHPYRVVIPLGFPGYQGVERLVGWVVRCVGNGIYIREKKKLQERYPDLDIPDPVEPCGFAMAMTPESGPC